MKKVILIAGAIAIIAGLYLASRQSGPESNSRHAETPGSNNPNLASPKSQRAATGADQSGGTDSETKSLAPIPSAVKPEVPYLLGSDTSPPSASPEVIMGKMRIAVHQYQSMFGGNPVGENVEITEALNGGNPKQARFISEESGLRINGRGELVDSWGTPFFFHQLSGVEMEIRSAGPDKKMWTQDDLITK